MSVPPTSKLAAWICMGKFNRKEHRERKERNSLRSSRSLRLVNLQNLFFRLPFVQAFLVVAGDAREVQQFHGFADEIERAGDHDERRIGDFFQGLGERL